MVNPFVVFSIWGCGPLRILVSYLLTRLSLRRLLCAAAGHTLVMRDCDEPGLNGTSFSVCRRCGDSRHCGISGSSTAPYFDILACNARAIPDPRNPQYIIGVRLNWYTATVLCAEGEAAAAMLFARHRRLPGQTRVLVTYVPGPLDFFSGHAMPGYLFDVGPDGAAEPAVPPKSRLPGAVLR